jgi:hypothetical protein
MRTHRVQRFEAMVQGCRLGTSPSRLPRANAKTKLIRRIDKPDRFTPLQSITTTHLAQCICPRHNSALVLPLAPH